MKTVKIIAITLILALTLTFVGCNIFDENCVKVSSSEELISAINSVKEGEFIKIEKDFNTSFDVGEEGSADIKRKVVLDLNGHTLTLGPAVGSEGTKSNGIRVLAFNTLTIKNGNLLTSNKEEDNVKISIANYGDLTLDNVKIYAGNLVQYTINNRGVLTLKNKTNVENGKQGVKVAITNDPYNAYYTNTNAVLNIKDQSVTTGKILLERYGNSTNQGVPELNITAGNIETIIEDGATTIGFVSNVTGGYFKELSATYLQNGYCLKKVGDSFQVVALES